MTNDSFINVLRDCIRPLQKSAVNASNSSGVRSQMDENENGAVIYIITVLTFYSLGVVVMIIQYLKTEKKELEEEATLDSFFKHMPDKRVEEEHRVNKVAIRAFHTLTSISYDDDELDDMPNRSLLVTDL